MFRDVVLPDTTAAEWPRIRASVHARIEATMAVDQFAFGEGNGQDFSTEQSRVEGLIQASREFQQVYPDWSLDGARLYVHQCALDILAAHARVDNTRLGNIGNSLGGRTVIYQAAFPLLPAGGTNAAPSGAAAGK
jgi:hypothetical protein